MKHYDIFGFYTVVVVVFITLTTIHLKNFLKSPFLNLKEEKEKK